MSEEELWNRMMQAIEDKRRAEALAEIAKHHLAQLTEAQQVPA